MKKLWLGLIIFLCGAAVICAASASYAAKYSYGPLRFNWGVGTVRLRNEKEFTADKIEKIDVSYRSENVIFLKGEKNKIVIKEYLQNKREDDSKIEVQGDTLYIHKNEGLTIHNVFIFGFLLGEERIEIYLPESYGGSIEAATSSGNIKADSAWNFKEFNVLASSGNISCGEIRAQEITAKASSGNISFDRAQGIRNMSTSSGNIKISGGEGDTYTKASSGNISVEGAAGSFSASASSGNISAEFDFLGENIEAETTSGNIRMAIPSGSSFSYDANATSGAINTDFDQFLSYNKKGNKAHGTYGENAKTTIITSTSSGNASIKLR